MEKGFNARRVVVLIVVVFAVVLSFLAGVRYGRMGHAKLPDMGTGQAGGSDRQGIPPDSLPH